MPRAAANGGSTAPEARLTAALSGWAQPPRGEPGRALVGVLVGEGIGPEIVAAAEDVLGVLERCGSRPLELRRGGEIGKAAERCSGRALTEEVAAWCEALFADGGALLCGPGGGRFVYELRARFDLFCKLTPVRPEAALRDAGALRPDAVESVDLVIVRENTAGLYFGEERFGEGPPDGDEVLHTFRYAAGEVRRILAVASALARQRRGRLCLVVKPSGIPEMSRLWIREFEACTAGLGLERAILEIDNAAYQLVASARSFDVVVAPNLFGDVLGDVAALLLGSRGLSYSGNFNASGFAVYQTGHGAAHDLRGRDVANPIAQIRAAGMMLRESFGMLGAAAALDRAIGRTLAAGFRTPDIAALDSKVVGTREMGRRIAEAFERELTPLAPLA